MIKISKYLCLYILFLVFIGFKGEIIATFAFVLLHEMCHYTAARILGYNGFDVKLLPIGAVLHLKDIDEAEWKEDFIISLAGPLMNFILALVFYVSNIFYPSDYLMWFYESNLSLAVFNLIPAFPLDGGRILRDILCRNNIYKRANEITVNISIFIGCFIMFLYFVLFFQGRSNINVGLISLFIIIVSIREKERIVYIIMGDIMKKRYKFLKRGFIENKSISIFYKKDLLTALSFIDKNKYNMFLILNEELNVLDMLYEDEIVDGLKEYGNISLEEFINKPKKIESLLNKLEF